MSILFTVWTSNREQKRFIIEKEGINLLERVILKASEKFSLNGSTLVLESNGTPVEQDEVLLILKSEILILLASGEQWIPPDAQKSLESTNGVCSLTTTETISTFSTKSFSEKNNTLVDITNTPVVLADANFEFIWANFEVPWQKIPYNLIEILELGQKWQDCKPNISEICHTIVYEMRLIKTKIPIMENLTKNS
ncbi:unnamed protein product [Brassicogethes aeneus]|uniref:CIDE-N domain-containing protein n=1 Tax=Brassicogethes aeneus TaxID=1431903 RepID=A0A9P0FMK3_BRAAE|nr:unnamed protein product [Brassicogethes aeneus]